MGRGKGIKIKGSYTTKRLDVETKKSPEQLRQEEQAAKSATADKTREEAISKLYDSIKGFGYKNSKDISDEDGNKYKYRIKDTGLFSATDHLGGISDETDIVDSGSAVKGSLKFNTNVYKREDGSLFMVSSISSADRSRLKVESFRFYEEFDKDLTSAIHKARKLHLDALTSYSPETKSELSERTESEDLGKAKEIIVVNAESVERDSARVKQRIEDQKKEDDEHKKLLTDIQSRKEEASKYYVGPTSEANGSELKERLKLGKTEKIAGAHLATKNDNKTFSINFDPESGRIFVATQKKPGYDTITTGLTDCEGDISKAYDTLNVLVKKEITADSSIKVETTRSVIPSEQATALKLLGSSQYKKEESLEAAEIFSKQNPFLSKMPSYSADKRIFAEGGLIALQDESISYTSVKTGDDPLESFSKKHLEDSFKNVLFRVKNKKDRKAMYAAEEIEKKKAAEDILSNYS